MPRFRMPERRNEAGYLLASTAVLLLIVIALVSSFAFVMTRNNHYQGNYAAGERLAELAVLAHYYAQQTHYNSTPYTAISNTNIYADMNLPDGFGFSKVANAQFVVEVIGADAAPLDVTVPASAKAASAYIHLAVKTFNGKGRSPSDDIALQAGAQHRGMARMGFYHIGYPAGDTCNNGEPTAVRWGNEASACLSDTQVAGLFPGGVQKGDIIVPAWETAFTRMGKDALIRYPQPERLDMSVMNAALNMGGKNIDKPDNIDSLTLNVHTMMSQTNPAGNYTTQKIDIAGPTTIQGPLAVYDQSGTVPVPMRFNGAAMTFTVGNSMKVATSVKGGYAPGKLQVSVVQPVAINTLAADNDTKMIVSPVSGALTAGVRNILQLGPLNVGKAGVGGPGIKGIVTVANTLEAKQAPINLADTSDPNFGLYGAQLTTLNGAQITNATNNLPWTVKSVNQASPTGSLVVDTFIAKVDCRNKAGSSGCPNPPVDPTGGL